ncbi:Ketoisovalerate oxidoreductase subunit VorA [Candidatus Tiddalikarchaeum anstoanum]|nr:Ketoisovalerate oxidoreductase subunit VorA [Candidatus Tiddalikarchaeum anstoanum]
MNVLNGAESAAYAMKQINPDVVAAYPITPQTEIMMKFAEFVANKEVGTKMVLVESEHSAMSAVVGASAGGVRAMTASSSAGLAYMFEVLGIASGLRLPIVMNIANRALSGPINIHCDHSDSMNCKDSGWIQLYSEDSQEVYDNTIIGVKLAEKLHLPLMVMQDGFITSHCLQNIELIKDKTVSDFVGAYNPETNLLNINKPITIGPLQLPDYLFETKRQQAEAMSLVEKEFNSVCREYEKITGRKYGVIEEYHSRDAKQVIVVLNSAAGTVKTVVNELRKNGKKVGLVKVKLFRPFPYEAVNKALSGAESVVVLDRSESFGANPPLYSEISNSLHNTSVKLSSVVFGLGGRDLFETDIKTIFENMISNKKQDKYVGVRE